MSKTTPKKAMIDFAGKKVKIKKLNLKKIAKLFEALDAIPKEMLDAADDKEAKNSDFMKTLPTVIMELLPKFSELAASTLDNQVTPEEIEEADYDEVFDLIEGFLQINDIPKIMERLGKTKALVTPKTKK